MNYFDLRPILKTLLVGCVIGIIAGYWICKKVTKPEIRTEVQKKEIVKTDIRTVTRTIERPDGSKETVTEITDKTKTTASKQAIVKVSKPNWAMGIAAESDYKLKPAYELELNRRVVGPIFVGLSINSEAKAGIRLLMEF